MNGKIKNGNQTTNQISSTPGETCDLPFFSWLSGSCQLFSSGQVVKRCEKSKTIPNIKIHTNHNAGWSASGGIKNMMPHTLPDSAAMPDQPLGKWHCFFSANLCGRTCEAGNMANMASPTSSPNEYFDASYIFLHLLPTTSMELTFTSLLPQVPKRMLMFVAWLCTLFLHSKQKGPPSWNMFFLKS